MREEEEEKRGVGRDREGGGGREGILWSTLCTSRDEVSRGDVVEFVCQRTHNMHQRHETAQINNTLIQEGQRKAKEERAGGVRGQIGEGRGEGGST